MTAGARIVAASLIASLAFSGPFAPAVFAQQPGTAAPPAAPVEPAQPAPPPGAQPMQGAPQQVFPETVKGPAPGAPRVMGQPSEPFQPGRSREMSDGAYKFAAGVSTMFLAPGRAITCVAGTTAFLVILAITLGSQYHGASTALSEGCGGQWVVTADDLRPYQRVLPVDAERQ
jgi:hypothetical protein